MGKSTHNVWTEARALLERGRERLIVRTAGEAATWAFPGGRLMPRESPETALRRICREALGVEIELLLGQPPFEHQFGDHRVIYRYYECRVRAGEARPPPGGELRWVLTEQLREYDFDAAAHAVVSWLLHSDRPRGK
ncbi:MAG: NUDIX domain-containing protein [Phycisphaerae bacterium]